MRGFIKFLIWLIIIVGIIAGLGKLFLFDIYTTQSNSMAPTIVSGDTFLVLKHFKPSRGSVVVCRDPRDPSQKVVGRIAGLPGEKVGLDRGILYINDEPIEQSALGEFKFTDNTKQIKNTYNFLLFQEKLGGHYFKIFVDPHRLQYQTRRAQNPIVVSPGHYFLVADNRVYGMDSRSYGQVKQSDCIGIAFFIIDPGPAAGDLSPKSRRFSFIP